MSRETRDVQVNVSCPETLGDKRRFTDAVMFPANRLHTMSDTLSVNHEFQAVYRYTSRPVLFSLFINSLTSYPLYQQQ